ncbi:hypothetical protein J1N35_043778 [Gossypium stocksii]|uniref:Uncharacterized protein n=1 Tax=Gossypium stocksii TaxID=47602 RepID=A0A9D3U846_9ROSI|nr:hypothetical protein J1N35_043778 [Gossypium stocksii]
MPGMYPSPFMYPNPYMFPFSSPMVGWNAWPGSYPFSITPAQPSIYRPPSHEGSHEAPSESSSFYQSPSPYGIQPPSPWMMQTPPGSLFYQGRSSSQHPQPDPLRRNHNPCPRNHNNSQKLNQGRIWCVTVDDPYVALIPTSTNIDFL